MAACRTFWGLPKEAQDAALWSLQVEAGRKTTWSIEGPCSFVSRVSVWLHSKNMLTELLGFQLCRTSWLRYMGIGKERLNRTKKRYRGLDERSLNQCTMAKQKTYVPCMSNVPFLCLNEVQLLMKHTKARK